MAVAATADIAAYPRLWQYATISRGLPDNAVRCVTGSPKQAGVPVLAGTSGGLVASTDGGQSWNDLGRLNATPLAGARINDLCYCPASTTPFYGIATDEARLFVCSNPLLPDVDL